MNVVVPADNQRIIKVALLRRVVVIAAEVLLLQIFEKLFTKLLPCTSHVILSLPSFRINAWKWLFTRLLTLRLVLMGEVHLLTLDISPFVDTLIWYIELLHNIKSLPRREIYCIFRGIITDFGLIKDVTAL
jgi:hypothetical protein